MATTGGGGNLGEKAEQMAGRAADKAKHMADRTAETTGGVFPSAAQWRLNWPTYLVYGVAGLGVLYLGQWAVTGKQPDWIETFVKRQEHKVDRAIHDVKDKAEDVRRATMGEARHVGNVVDAKAEQVRDQALDEARNVTAGVQNKADDVRRRQ